MPSYVVIRNRSQTERSSIRARYCDTFLCRLRGLTFRRSLAAGEGLLLVQEKDSKLDTSIHMLFMWMDLTIVWIDDSFSVVDVKLARRWRLAYFPAKPARYVLETGVENQNLYAVGDSLVFERQDVA
jgi:uncharacterized membrane protein (UPF0127 family)